MSFAIDYEYAKGRIRKVEEALDRYRDAGIYDHEQHGQLLSELNAAKNEFLDQLAGLFR